MIWWRFQILILNGLTRGAYRYKQTYKQTPVVAHLPSGRSATQLVLPNYVPTQLVWHQLKNSRRIQGASSRIVQSAVLPPPKHTPSLTLSKAKHRPWAGTASSMESVWQNPRMHRLRTLELSKSKNLSDKYQPSRDVAWPVTQASLYAVASNRLDELSKPIKRETMDHLQFNPDAFRVSTNALKAKTSKRVDELAEPLERLKK